MRHLRITLIIAMALVAHAGAAPGAPALLSYQGQLTDAGGVPITASTEVRVTLLWGGTATEVPSTGKPVYQEDVSITPDSAGVFHHLIGSGTPTSLCDEDRDGTAAELCELTPADFPDAATVVYLELRVDPIGLNDTLLPRQQIASVGYSLNSDTVDGVDAQVYFKSRRPNYRSVTGASSQVIVEASSTKPAYFVIGEAILSVSASVTMDLDVSGIGGLRAGLTKAPDQLYYLYAVDDGGTPALIADTSDPATGLTGFTDWTYVGGFVTRGNGNIAPFQALNGRFRMWEGVSNHTVTASGTLEAKILTIPPGAKEVYGRLRLEGQMNVGEDTRIAVRPSGQTIISIWVQEQGRTNGQFVSVPLVVSRTIYMKSSLASLTTQFLTLGWTEDPTEFP